MQFLKLLLAFLADLSGSAKKQRIILRKRTVKNKNERKQKKLKSIVC